MITLMELKDFMENQIGFKSTQTIISLAKGTDEVKRYIHQDQFDKEIRSVKTTIKGKEQKLTSSVLEKRVFKSEPQKKRSKTAKSRKV